MIVVDANILVYSLVANERSELARLVREKDPDWVFPILWRYEFGNALSLIVRQKELTQRTASQVLEKALDSFGPGEQEADGNHALELALERGLTFYDAQYLSLAQSLGVPLVTEDKALRKNGRGLAVSMEEFLK